MLKSLLDNAKIINYRLWAINSPFDRKDDLKQRGYRWSAGNNGEPKAWYIDIEESDLDKELAFLRDEIKLQNVEQLPKKKINALTRYSKRV